MHRFLFIVFILLFACNNNAQENSDSDLNNSETIEIKDYLFFNEGDTRIYECEFNGKNTIDTVIIKGVNIGGEEGFYPWKNDQLYFIFSNSFLGGITVVRDGSIYFKEVYEADQIINIVPEDLKILFPASVEFGTIYKTENHFGYKVEYKVIQKESVKILGTKYPDCIKITKTSYWDEKQNVDQIWLAKDVGLIKWKRSTGRVELLQNFKNEVIDKKEQSGKIYVNSKGKQVDESELIESNKHNSDFSMAEYDDNGRLIREEFFGTTGEMGIKFITYEYNEKGLLVKELYHYTESIDPEKPIKSIWLNQYFYNQDDKLIQSKHKFDVNDEDFYDIREYDELPSSDVANLIYSKRHPLTIK